ncbi:hypothetical protein [Nocardia sp. NPDC004750]
MLNPGESEPYRFLVTEATRRIGSEFVLDGGATADPVSRLPDESR